MQHQTKVVADRVIALIVCMVFIGAALSFGMVPRAFAATNVTNRYDKIGDASAGAITSHLVGFTYTNFSVPVGSVLIEFCANDPIPGTPCTAPNGFSLTSATLNTQAGETGFSIDGSSTANRLILTRPAVAPLTGNSVYEFNNVRNPDTAGTYYIRIQTFTSTDATGVDVEEGGIAVSVNGPIVVSTEVPPYLKFCVSVAITSYDCTTANSYYIDFGEFSQSTAKTASSQMVAASNAAYGYSIFATGTTFTSGNNTIPALASPTASAPGTSQFGINLRSNSQPNMGQDPVGPGTATPTANYGIQNRFMFHPGDSIVSGVTSQDYRKYTATYVVNISGAQPPGIYTTTITYICLANF